MLVSNLMNNLNGSMSRLDKLNNQMTSGRKYGHISDDPTALIYSQSARNKLARLDNYQRTVGTAQSWLLQAESGVMELQTTLVNVYEAAVDAANDPKGSGEESDKAKIAAMVAQMRDHYVDTLNATFGDKFVFGGYNTPGDPTVNTSDQGVKAFTVETVDIGGVPTPQLFYNGFNLSQFDGMTLEDYTNNFMRPQAPPPGFDPAAPNMSDPAHVAYLNAMAFQTLRDDVLTFDVGTGVSMPVTMNGIELVLFMTPGEDASGNATTVIRNAFNVMQDFYELANAGAPADDISKMIKPLQDAQNHLLTKTAEIGGRVRRLELLEARYEQDAINYEQMRSDAEDADMAEVIMKLKMAEAVHQAALSAGARVIQPTLMDFLR